MKLKNKLLYVIASILVLGTTASCRNWLDVVSDDRIMENNLFKNQDGFLVALNGIYIDLISSSLYNGNLTVSGFDVLAQYWQTSGNKDHSYYSLSNFTEANKQSLSGGIWSKCHPMLNNINTLIEHCDNEQGKLTPQFYKLIKGEALALRALIHFELFRVFGPICKDDDMNVKTIPYATSSELIIRPLLPASEIIEKIYKDLADAELLLKESDPVTTKGPDAIEVEDESNDLKFRNLRMNYYAVKALTARVALYANDKEKAYTYASSVIKEVTKDNIYFPFTSRAFASAVDNQDRVYSSEIIFGIYNSKTSEDIHNQLFGNNKENNNVLMMPKNCITNLYNGYEGDVRKSYLWKEEMNPNAELNIYFIKYKKWESSPSVDDPNKLKHRYYIPVIKLPEMFLIVAECKYETVPKEAIDAINAIREARNAPKITEGANLLTVIQFESAREFIGEGQLFWFYKRNNFKSIPKLSYLDTSNEYVPAAMDTKQYYFELPQNEISSRK